MSRVGREISKKSSVLIQVIAYAVAFGVGLAVLQGIDESHPLLKMLWADIAATLVIFAFSLVMNNSSMYDPFWSLIPVGIGLYWFWPQVDGSVTFRAVAIMLVLSCWGLRLTWNFLVSWPGMQHEDWRYREFREKFGALYWLVSLSGIHFFPTLIVFAGMLPVWASSQNLEVWHWLEMVGLTTGLGAVLIQGVADTQLRRHRASNPPKGSILDTGLWKYSRHPNYFGEVLIWWSLALFGFASAPESVWVWSGAIAMTCLFVFSSVPWTDRKTMDSRPRYAERMKKVSGLVPWFPKS